MDVGEGLAGQKAVVGHGVEDAGLAEQHDQHDAGETGQRAQGDDVAGPGESAVERRRARWGPRC